MWRTRPGTDPHTNLLLYGYLLKRFHLLSSRVCDNDARPPGTATMNIATESSIRDSRTAPSASHEYSEMVRANARENVYATLQVPWLDFAATTRPDSIGSDSSIFVQIRSQ